MFFKTFNWHLRRLTFQRYKTYLYICIWRISLKLYFTAKQSPWNFNFVTVPNSLLTI
jgi:hypothetical protein